MLKEYWSRFKARDRYGPHGWKRVWSLKYSLMLLVIFQVFDSLSTLLALRVEGTTELNPIFRPFLEDGEPMTMVMLKWIVVTFVFLAVAFDPRDTKTDFTKWGLVIMNFVYAVILTSNFATYGIGTGNWTVPIIFYVLVGLIAIVAYDEIVHGGAGSKRIDAWLKNKFHSE